MKLGAYKIIMSLLVILFMPTLIQSCCGDLASYYDVTGIQVKNIEGELDLSLDVYKEVDSVATEKYGLLIEPQIRYYTLNNFTTNLYACSEDLGGKGTKERIETIQVTSNQDFDQAHLAGSSLNDLFLLNYPTSKEISELTQFLQTHRSAFQADFVLRLKKKPDKSLLHQFTIRYSHIDGEAYEETTKPIKLL